MIRLYYNDALHLGIVTQDGMPSLVLSDDHVVEFDVFVREMANRSRQAGKSSQQAFAYDIIRRYDDFHAGWVKL